MCTANVRASHVSFWILPSVAAGLLARAPMANHCLLRDLRPFPPTIARITYTVPQDLVFVAAPVIETPAVNLQQKPIFVQLGESWATAQDHPIPTSACSATLSGALARICSAFIRSIRALLPEHLPRVIAARGELHIRADSVLGSDHAKVFVSILKKLRACWPRTLAILAATCRALL